uniref:Uncharacterized protein n=1 Tax=Megaselia scalaris TaxID=36166 RepID=T1H6B6_MEGSC
RNIDQEDEEVEEGISLEMNWTIAENLPTDNGCQDKFEHIITFNKQSPAQAIKQIAIPHMTLF